MNRAIKMTLICLVAGLSGAGAFLSAAEAQPGAALEQDWLAQADGKPTVARALDEIKWAREMAARLTAQKPDAGVAAALGLLAGFETELGKPDLAAEAVAKLYLQVRQAKRQIMFADPHLDFSKILLIDIPYPKNPEASQWDKNAVEWGHEARHRNGFMSPVGGRLLVLDGLNPDAPVKDLLGGQEGSHWRPGLSYDGKKVVFSHKPKGERSFHLFEVNSDGSGLKQLTFGDYDDLDPLYLPDGHLMFCTTRGNTYIRCMPETHAFQLARCDGNGKNLYIISANSECDYTPAVMNDGRVVYSRWEYTDKGLWRVQSLWTCNPDGTQVATFWGNQSVWPDMMIEAQPIPGSPRIMFTGAGHHGWFDGCIGIIDHRQGMNYPDGLTKVTSERPWPESGNGPKEKAEAADYHMAGKAGNYKTPYPLGEELFLVSAREGGNLYNGSDNGWFFRLYLMDIHGNRELVYRGQNNILHAMPMKARTRPPVIPDRVEWPKIGVGAVPAKGVLFSSNVFANAPDIPREKVKYLRIIQMDHKTYSSWHKEQLHDGPSVSVTQADTVKRILGTVPVEADGSVCFKLEPGSAVYFQLLDDRYQCIKTMRSFTNVMPGEIRGCLGCHEGKSQAPFQEASASANVIAVKKGAVEITPEPWKNETIGFLRFAQPVFDKHCATCHQGKGEAVAKLDLTLRDSKVGFRQSGTRPFDKCAFKEPYLSLVSKGQRVSWGHPGPFKANEMGAVCDNLAGVLIVEGYGTNDPAGLKTMPAMSMLSPVSKLIANASSGKHHGAKVPEADLRRLIAWVDCNGPYLGREEIDQMYDPSMPNLEKFLLVRPRVGTAPVINRFDIRQDGDSSAVAGQPLRLFNAAAGWPAGEKPEIVKAVYGANDKQLDVTAKLKSVLAATLVPGAQNYNDLFTDPASGVVKTLTIDYKAGGKTTSVTLDENQTIVLPYPK